MRAVTEREWLLWQVWFTDLGRRGKWDVKSADYDVGARMICSRMAFEGRSYPVTVSTIIMRIGIEVAHIEEQQSPDQRLQGTRL
jgi:hypothetical protein